MLDAGVAVAHEFSIFVMDEVRDDPLPGNPSNRFSF
jgi:hypothetical protein